MIKTYEEIYSDPKKAIIRSSSDANIVGLRNGQEVTVVCDRKWGEFTPESLTYMAYSRSGSYQNANQTLETAVYKAIYEPGSNSVVAGDTHKDYEIIGMWNAVGTALDYSNIGLSCFLVSDNPRIRIYNGSGSSRSWNHIEYKAHDVFRFYNASNRTDYTLKGTKYAYNRNGISTIERTPSETYMIVGTYMADGTQILTPADLEVRYNSSLRQIKISTQYEHTFAYVDVVVTGGDTPSVAAMNLDDEY